MDTRKLILHIDGDSGAQSRIELEDFGVTHYIDGDTDRVAELVKRYNTYPELLSAMERIFEHAYDEDTPNENIRDDFDAMRKIARAAIAKATNP